MNNIHLVHYGDSRFEISKKRFISEAASFGIKNIYTYSPDNLPEWFLKEHKDYIYKNKRGGGYWLWKFCIVQEVMSKINYGDIILYVDTGCSFNPLGIKRFEEYIDIVKENDILTFHMNDQIEIKWNKRDLIKFFECEDDSNILFSGQIISGIWFMKKTLENEEIIKNLYEICCLKWTVDDSPSKSENYQEFIEHRHDQSVFSLFMKKHGKKSISDETFTFNWNSEESKKWPIHALRLRDPVKIDTENSKNLNNLYYNKFKKNIYSKNGEDGILNQIIKELNITPNFLCEIGANTGISSNTRAIMLNYNSKCIMIESSTERFKRLKSKNNNEKVICINALISDKKYSKNNIDSILSKLNAPEDFDLLSINIGGAGHQIWDSCEKFKPKIVIIKISSFIHPEYSGSLKEYTDEKYSNFEGYMCGFKKSLEFFNKKEYSAICHSDNLIYIRNDLINMLSIDKNLINNINLFDWSWYKSKN